MYCDSSDYGLGVVVVQFKDQIPYPVYFYSRKYNSVQLRYTAVHKEALAVISILRHLRKMLYGQKLIVYTDSLNLGYMQNSNSQKLQRYHLEIVEFSPDIKHIEGTQNHFADLLSRMNFDQSVIELFEVSEFPLSSLYIQTAQKADKVLCKIWTDLNNTTASHGKYHLVKIEGHKVLCAIHTKQMIVPESIRQEILTWNHETFGHFFFYL